MVSASPMIAPTVMRGLSEANGSWKMICMSRRSARKSAAIERGDVPALEPDLAGGRLDQPQDAAAGGRFARSRIRRPGRAFRPARCRSSTSSTACTRLGVARQKAAADREVLHQVFDAQQRLGHGAASSSRPHAARRRPCGRRRRRAAAASASRQTRHREAAARREAAAGRRIRAGSAPRPRWPRAASCCVAAVSMRGIERIRPCV